MLKGTCCCCFSNSVRYLVLLLQFALLTSMFANILLFNVAVVFDDKLLESSHFSINRIDVTEDLPQGRFRRQLDMDKNAITDEFQFTDPTIGNTVVQEDPFSDNFIDIGSPVVPTEEVIPATTVPSGATTKPPFVGPTTPKLVFFTRQSPPSTTTTPTTPFISSKWPEKEEEAFTIIANTHLVDYDVFVAAAVGDNSNATTVAEDTSVALTNSTLLTSLGTEAPSALDETTTTASTAATTIATTAISTEALADEVVNDVKREDVPAEETFAPTTEEDVTISPYMGNFLPSNPLLALSQATTFSAPGLGMLIFYVPASYCLRRFGTQITAAFFAIVSAAATAVLPFLLGFGNIPVIVLRFIQGAAFAAALPIIGATAARWGSLKEQLFFLTFSILFFQIAPILSWPLAAVLFSGGHVQLGFLLHAILTVLLALSFFLFHRNDPQHHKWVNGLEMNKIASGKTQNNRILEKSLCSLLFHSISSWCVWTAAVGHFFALSIVVLFMPVYLFTVLNIKREKTPLFAASPFVLMLLSQFISTIINKFCNCTTHTIKIRICNTIAFVGTAVFFVLLAILPPSEEFYDRSVILLLFLLLPLGFSQAGFYQSSVIIGRYYSQFIVANLQVALGFAFTVAPFVVFFITSDNSTNQWRICFAITAAVLILCNIVFCIFGSGRPSHWAEDSWNPFITHKTVDRHADSSTECGILEMRTISEFRETTK
ncbi:hypothetical protein L596_002277 [Steinernema carpocapsae]|uniref:Major facilitator superfamily (MFS) profile domain-containing protein n=1 Tax=Steinernema carpocapsae TaxID=34508 RepID=A0A4U8URF1_STECR|nr:hypothetical protein L596_002277 [Steinernema carpocapsae]